MTVRLDRELQRFIELGIALSSETNLHRLLNKIVSELRQLTNADGGSLYLKEGTCLRFEVCQNETIRQQQGSQPELNSFVLPIDEHSISGYVALTGKPLIIADVYRLPAGLPCRFDPRFDEHYHYRTRSQWVLPLKDHQSEVVAVLQLINARDAQGQVIPFPARHQDFLLSLASLAAVAINNARLIQTVEDLFESLMIYSVSAIDARSPQTAGHSRRVAELCLALARAVNDCRQGPLAEISLNDKELEELRYAAWLHDIGKIGVRDSLLDKDHKLPLETMAAIRWRIYLAQAQAESPQEQEALEADYHFLEEINQAHCLPAGAQERLQALAARDVVLPSGHSHPLLKPLEVAVLSIPRGNLTSAEYREIQDHALYTFNILRKIPFSKDLARVPNFAAAHHERLDGSGYPFQLTAADIPLQARIMAIADIFDALTARDRPYRDGGSRDTVLEFLRQEAGAGRLDPDLVELFIAREVYREGEQPPREPETADDSCCRCDGPGGPG